MGLRSWKNDTWQSSMTVIPSASNVIPFHLLTVTLQPHPPPPVPSPAPVPALSRHIHLVTVPVPLNPAGFCF